MTISTRRTMRITNSLRIDLPLNQKSKRKLLVMCSIMLSIKILSLPIAKNMRNNPMRAKGLRGI